MRRARVIWMELACAIVALGLACAQRAGDTGDDVAGTGSDDTGGELDPCACVPADDPNQDPQAPPPLPTCVDTLCEIVSVHWDDFDHYLGVSNPDALECVVEALAERTPGLLRWTYSASNFEEGGSDYTTHHYLVIREDGTGVHRRWTETADSLGVGEAVVGEFRYDASDYADCLVNSVDESEMYDDCLRSEPILDGMVCSEGWTADRP